VVFRSAVLFDGSTVGFGGVAGVAGPAVLGVVFCNGRHVSVAVGFGEDTGGGDGLVLSVALDDAFVRNGAVGDEKFTIDQQKIGTFPELIQGTVHRTVAGAKNVVFIDLLDTEAGHRPAVGVFLDLLAKFVASGFVQLFTVVEQGVVVAGGQNDGSGEYGAGQAAAPGFVAAGFGAAGGMER